MFTYVYCLESWPDQRKCLLVVFVPKHSATNITYKTTRELTQARNHSSARNVGRGSDDITILKLTWDYIQVGSGTGWVWYHYLRYIISRGEALLLSSLFQAVCPGYQPLQPPQGPHGILATSLIICSWTYEYHLLFNIYYLILHMYICANIIYQISNKTFILSLLFLLIL